MHQCAVNALRRAYSGEAGEQPGCILPKATAPRTSATRRENTSCTVAHKAPHHGGEVCLAGSGGAHGTCARPCGADSGCRRQGCGRERSRPAPAQAAAAVPPAGSGGGGSGGGGHTRPSHRPGLLPAGLAAAECLRRELSSWERPTGRALRERDRAESIAGAGSLPKAGALRGECGVWNGLLQAGRGDLLPRGPNAGDQGFWRAWQRFSTADLHFASGSPVQWTAWTRC